MKTGAIQIRDPFVYVDQNEKTYYMFGTTDQDCWYTPGQGFDCYRSKNLRRPWTHPWWSFGEGQWVTNYGADLLWAQ